MSSPPCVIVTVGKRRDGGSRFWCTAHKADATAKYGVAAGKCRYADVPPVKESERLLLDLSKYQGGVAVWGAVPPVYDTTKEDPDVGVHVHARKLGESDKSIDGSYREVVVVENGKRTTVTDLDAISFLTSTVLGLTVKQIECTYCGHPHLDKDWFSVHEHSRHLCAGCGKIFRDREAAIGNPLAKFSKKRRTHTTAAPRTLEISQAGFAGGIQLWASNPSILWTGDKPEQEGIHLHAFNSAGKRVEDDTFSQLTIDDYKLDASLLRVYMAQMSLPHLSRRVLGLECPRCKAQHRDTDALEYTPHDPHVCEECGSTFRSSGQLKRTISNPVASVLRHLAKHAVRQPRLHSLGSLPETLSAPVPAGPFS